MLTKILIAIAVLVAAFVLLVASRPSEFRVSRSIHASVPPAAVFPYLNNQKRNAEWSPWMELDPNMKQTYGGPEEGVGASVTWDGNDQVGAGTSTIVESRPDELVRVKLDFLRPFEGTSMADFTLQPEGEGTLITWSMYGENNFIGKAMGLFMDCEKMCGDQFDKGLAKLKSTVESKG